jgi:hypothetical protein
MVLDLGELDFLDSMGLAGAARGREALTRDRSNHARPGIARETWNRPRIRQDSAAVRRVITVSGLEGSLPLVES